MKQKSKEEYMDKLRSLIDIGVALSCEKELNGLLKILMKESINVTQAEGASLYLVRENSKQEVGNVISLQKESLLYFLKSINRIQGQFDQKGSLPIDSNSLAGYTALTKEILNLKNCYKIPKDAPYRFNEHFDNTTGYKTKSMLTLIRMGVWKYKPTVTR